MRELRPKKWDQLFENFHSMAIDLPDESIVEAGCVIPSHSIAFLRLIKRPIRNTPNYGITSETGAITTPAPI